MNQLTNIPREGMILVVKSKTGKKYRCKYCAFLNEYRTLSNELIPAENILEWEYFI